MACLWGVDHLYKAYMCETVQACSLNTSFLQNEDKGDCKKRFWNMRVVHAFKKRFVSSSEIETLRADLPVLCG